MLEQTIFLFDIDGVLVEPHGYRAAVRASLEFFTRRLGTGADHLPGEDEISLFEASRITSEWDMVPLALAVLFDALLDANPGARLPRRLWQMNGWRPRRIPPQVNYRPAIQAMAAALQPGMYPAESVLAAAKAGQAGLLPKLRGCALLSNLLARTREVRDSLTTRIFQHYSLGSQVFQQVYEMSPLFDTPSLLGTLDRPQLEPGLRQRVLEKRAAGGLHLAAYTMRPSLPPLRTPVESYGYAPEAELALEIAGLQELPLIGYGRVRYLASLHGRSPEEFLKPSPVQALAAALAALYGEEMPALQDGMALYTTGKISERLQAALSGRQTHLHVFEDTPGGVEAVLRAAEILSAAGFDVQAHAWGIARQEDKVLALRFLGAQVMDTTGEAVELALSGVN